MLLKSYYLENKFTKMVQTRWVKYFLIVDFLIVLSSCGGGSSTNPSMVDNTAVCGPFPDWQTSVYKLPYAVGTSYFLNQSNCSGFGHSGFWTYGYDFIMDIGTEVTAMRSGVVVHTQDGTIDGDPTGTNLILIKHENGTIALYSHLTIGGVIVDVGQNIVAGESIGLSGNTGNTGGLPHLHVSIHPCAGLPGLTGIAVTNCPTQPYNFSNTDPNPDGLIAGRSYTALAD